MIKIDFLLNNYILFEHSYNIYYYNVYFFFTHKIFLKIYKYIRNILKYFFLFIFL